MDQFIILTDITERVFAIDPTTVFGVLCGLLMLAVGYQTRQVSLKDSALKEANDEHVKLLRDTLETLKDLVNTNSTISDHMREIKERLSR